MDRACEDAETRATSVGARTDYNPAHHQHGPQHGRFLRAAHSELALRAAWRTLGAGRQPTADQQAHRQPPARLLHHAGAQTAQTTAPAGGNGARPSCRRGQQRQSALRPGRPHQRRAPTARRLARVAGPPVAGDAADRPAAPTLAAPLLPRHPAVLLPGGSCGDGDLAHRSGAGPWPRSTQHPRAPAERQRRRQSGALAPRAEAGHRRRQDHGDGHAHRVADGECRAASGKPPLHAGLPGGDAGHHHPRTAASAYGQRPGQLLPSPRAGAAGHAAGLAARHHRHRQLPRLHPPRAHVPTQRQPHLAGRPRPGAANAGDRRPDAAPGDAGTDGHEAHPRVQRRRPPLLPRAPCGGHRGGRSQGGGTRRSQAQSRSGPGVDLRLGSRPREAGAKPRDRSLRHAVLPARLRLRGRHAFPVDGVRFLADGRHRVRHRQAAPGAGGGQQSPAPKCPSTATSGSTSARQCRGRAAAPTLAF